MVRIIGLLGLGVLAGAAGAQGIEIVDGASRPDAIPRGAALQVFASMVRDEAIAVTDDDRAVLIDFGDDVRRIEELVGRQAQHDFERSCKALNAGTTTAHGVVRSAQRNERLLNQRVVNAWEQRARQLSDAGRREAENYIDGQVVPAISEIRTDEMVANAPEEALARIIGANCATATMTSDEEHEAYLREHLDIEPTRPSAPAEVDGGETRESR
jgi:hypothetical protein